MGAALEFPAVGEPLSLWWAALDGAGSPPAAPDLTACLSPDEERRADRLQRPLDRERFRAARGWLRRVLATELGCAPGEVRFVVEEGGKPRVAGSELRFSAARSEDVALYALSWRMEVGVDVEAIRTSVDVDGLARRFFSAAEQRALGALAPERRVHAVYDCWTRKEAYVKGTGTGLSIDLSAADVWSDDRGVSTIDGWTIHQLSFHPRFAAAVAIAELGEGWQPARPRRLDSSGPTPFG